MIKLLLLAALPALLISSCQVKPKTLQEQLTDNFKAHLKTTDSLATLDTFSVLRIDTITAKEGQIIEDSILSRERARLVAQLNSARISNNSDSIVFVQYEIDHIQKVIDSMESYIKKADVVKKYGFLVIGSYVITKQNRSESGSVYYFTDTAGTVMNPDMIDELIKGTIKKMN